MKNKNVMSNDWQVVTAEWRLVRSVTERRLVSVVEPSRSKSNQVEVSRS
jgi:hypothetical protein